jgi:hypothetical protein
VELLDDRDVEALLRDQHFDVATAQGRWNGGVE